MIQNCKNCCGVLLASIQTRIDRNLLRGPLAGSAWRHTSYHQATQKHIHVGGRNSLTSENHHLSKKNGLAVRTSPSLEMNTVCYHQGIHIQITFPRSFHLAEVSVNSPKCYGMNVAEKDYLCILRNKIGPRLLSPECGIPNLSKCERFFLDQNWTQSGTRPGKRYLSTSPNLSHPVREENVMNVFDRKTKRKQRDRAALAKDVEVYDYIKDEIAYRMVDRIRDVTRKFPVAVDLGCGRGLMANYLTEDEIGTLYQCEMSEKMLDQVPTPEGVKTIKLVADEEFVPFKEETLDLVISSLSLHWVNDLPGTLRQIHTALKKDGAFIGAIFGGDTLFELRCSLQLAELEREGGFAPHISPFADMQDIGNLLTRSGYNMLTVDKEELQVNYPSMYELMHDLKGMAENNASWSRKNYLQRDTMAAAAAIYKAMYGNEDGSIPATFQVLFMIGWKPDKSQAKPAARGSATASLKDLDKLNMDVPPKE